MSHNKEKDVIVVKCQPDGWKLVTYGDRSLEFSPDAKILASLEFLKFLGVIQEYRIEQEHEDHMTYPQWEDLTIEDKADFCSLIGADLLCEANEPRIKALYNKHIRVLKDLIATRF